MAGRVAIGVPAAEPKGLARAPRSAYELLECPRYSSVQVLTAKDRMYGWNRNVDQNPCQVSPILYVLAIDFKLTNG
jgi:hypothetical protein